MSRLSSPSSPPASASGGSSWLRGSPSQPLPQPPAGPDCHAPDSPGAGDPFPEPGPTGSLESSAKYSSALRPSGSPSPPGTGIVSMDNPSGRSVSATVASVDRF